MYKVFINEKKLSIDIMPNDAEKNLIYEDFSSIEIAMDLLENTSCKGVNLYGDDAEKIWEDFCDSFANIEAAGGIVKNQEGKYLFIYRLGKWDLPKGKVEPSETLENAALREVEEETGIRNLQLVDFVNPTYHIYREKQNNAPILKTTFWYLMSENDGQQPVPQTEEGISKVEWKSVENIRTEVLPNTFRNIQNILTEAGVV